MKKHGALLRLLLGTAALLAAAAAGVSLLRTKGLGWRARPLRQAAMTAAAAAMVGRALAGR